MVLRDRGGFANGMKSPVANVGGLTQRDVLDGISLHEWSSRDLWAICILRDHRVGLRLVGTEEVPGGSDERTGSGQC